MDFAGGMAGYVTEPVALHTTEALTDQITNHVRNRRDRLENQAMHGLSGIGIAITSVVDHTGYVTASADFDLNLGHLATTLDGTVPECPPVSVENDANCTALFADHQDPKPRSSTLALVFTDHPSTVGAGLCINGRIYRGFNGSAGELLPMRSSRGYGAEWEDNVTSTAVRFIDPEVVVVAATEGRRNRLDEDHPQLRLELVNRREYSVDAGPAATAGAAQLAYQHTVSSLIEG